MASRLAGLESRRLLSDALQVSCDITLVARKLYMNFVVIAPRYLQTTAKKTPFFAPNSMINSDHRYFVCNDSAYLK